MHFCFHGLTVLSNRDAEEKLAKEGVKRASRGMLFIYFSFLK